MDHLLDRTTGCGRAASSRPAADVTLFCVPHAGGSAAYYTKFGSFFSSGVDVRPLELPGRGRRYCEPFLTGVEALSRDLFARILPIATGRPYALFGHSMGALLAHRCAQLAAEARAPLPAALFVSSSAVPGRRGDSGAPLPSPLTPEAVWAYVVRMGGVPQCVVESAEFRDYLAPILLADFSAVEAWRPPPATPLPIPIAAFLGSDDLVTEPQARQWAVLTTRGCEVHKFSGNHFYLQDHWAALAERIRQILERRP